MPNTAKLLTMVNWFPNTRRKGKLHFDLHLADYMYILVYTCCFSCLIEWRLIFISSYSIGHLICAITVVHLMKGNKSVKMCIWIRLCMNLHIFLLADFWTHILFSKIAWKKSFKLYIQWLSKKINKLVNLPERIYLN